MELFIDFRRATSSKKSAETLYDLVEKYLTLYILVVTNIKGCIMRIILLFSSLFISSAAFANNVDDARKTIKAFSTDLKQVLVSTLQQSGPVYALSVCNTAAPAIALQHSNSKWQISRSALKTRNSDNQPDAWLKCFIKF